MGSFIKVRALERLISLNISVLKQVWTGIVLVGLEEEDRIQFIT